MKRSQTISTILLCLTIGVASCDYLPNKKPKYEVAPLRVKVQKIENQTTVCSHVYVGKIEETSSVPLSMQATGQVIAVQVKKGDHVKKGQELLRIDDTQAKNALQAANATLRQAQDGYNRAKKVYKAGGVTDQKMVELSSQLDQARSMVAISRKSLNDCVLYAPSDGIIGDCKVKIGQVVAPGIGLVTLLDMEEYNVVFDVAETDITHIQVGDSGVITIDALGKTETPIYVTEKNLIANTIAHTYTVTALLFNPADEYKQQLLPGMVSKVRLASQNVSGFFVPTACVQTLTSGPSVWVAQGYKAQRRHVTIGQYTATGVIITNGLAAGDYVITEGFQKMYSGADIYWE